MKGGDEHINQPVKTGIISQKENFSSSLNNLFQCLKVSDTGEYYSIVLQRLLNEQNLISTKNVPGTSLITDILSLLSDRNK